MASQQPLEMILLKQVARHLASPIWIHSANGELAFYNEPAEVLLGIEFSDIGPVADIDLTEMFEVTDLADEPLAQEDLPVIKTLQTRNPSNRRVKFRGRDDVSRVVEVVAMPIIVHGDRFLGVLTAFWEVNE